MKKAEAALAEADKKIREATASSDIGTHLKLIQPATAPDRPSHPRPASILLRGALIGFVIGLALTLLGRR